MSAKVLILICMTIGSFIGGYIPSLFGAPMLSFYGLIFSFFGGLAGIYAGYKLSKSI